MKSFQQYLSEIFRPKQEYSHRRRHPDLVRVWPKDKEFINYRHIPKGKDGKPVLDPKTGKPKQDCKVMKKHKKHEGTAIPEKK